MQGVGTIPCENLSMCSKIKMKKELVQLGLKIAGETSYLEGRYFGGDTFTFLLLHENRMNSGYLRPESRCMSPRVPPGLKGMVEVSFLFDQKEHVAELKAEPPSILLSTIFSTCQGDIGLCKKKWKWVRLFLRWRASYGLVAKMGSCALLRNKAKEKSSADVCPTRQRACRSLLHKYRGSDIVLQNTYSQTSAVQTWLMRLLLKQNTAEIRFRGLLKKHFVEKACEEQYSQLLPTVGEARDHLNWMQHTLQLDILRFGGCPFYLSASLVITFKSTRQVSKRALLCPAIIRMILQKKLKLFDTFGSELRQLTSGWLGRGWENGCSTYFILKVRLFKTQQDYRIPNEDTAEVRDPKNLTYESNPIVNKHFFQSQQIDAKCCELASSEPELQGVTFRGRLLFWTGFTTFLQAINS